MSTKKKLLSVSTKTGDAGTSGLANGERLPKSALIFEVLGAQDELNSWLGLVIARMGNRFVEQKKFLLEVQDTLFFIGAELARSPKAKLAQKSLEKLERLSDELQLSMGDGWTTKFLYPGGNELAATTDIARTVSRRFERLVVSYSQQEPVSSLVFQYVNRLSDYLFVLRCFINHQEQVTERTFESDEAYARRFE